MKKEEAITIIQSMIDSLMDKPNQFIFNINVSGTQITSTGNGVGMNVAVSGGGIGNNIIGFQSTLKSNSIEIAQGQANSQMRNDLKDIISILESIREGLLNDQPKSDLENLYHNLKNTWFPGVATSVIGNILSLILGISI